METSQGGLKQVKYFDYWTVQDASILEQIQDTGYLPHIDDSIYLKDFYPDTDDDRRELVRLYHTAVNGVCTANDLCPTSIDGVVFAFAKFDAENLQIASINTFDEFYRFVQNNKDTMQSCWTYLSSNPNAVVMHLRFPETYLPVHLDLNGWNYCAPPMSPWMNEDERRKNIIKGLANGSPQYSGLLGGLMPNDVIQCHLPFIRKENLVDCYPMFSLMDSSEPDLVMIQYFAFIQEAMDYGVDAGNFPKDSVDASNILFKLDGAKYDFPNAPFHKDWMRAYKKVAQTLKKERKDGVAQ